MWGKPKAAEPTVVNEIAVYIRADMALDAVFADQHPEARLERIVSNALAFFGSVEEATIEELDEDCRQKIAALFRQQAERFWPEKC